MRNLKIHDDSLRISVYFPSFVLFVVVVVVVAFFFVFFPLSHSSC